MNHCPPIRNPAPSYVTSTLLLDGERKRSVDFISENGQIVKAVFESGLIELPFAGGGGDTTLPDSSLVWYKRKEGSNYYVELIGDHRPFLDDGTTPNPEALYVSVLDANLTVVNPSTNATITLLQPEGRSPLRTQYLFGGTGSAIHNGMAIVITPTETSPGQIPQLEEYYDEELYEFMPRHFICNTSDAFTQDGQTATEIHVDYVNMQTPDGVFATEDLMRRGMTLVSLAGGTQLGLYVRHGTGSTSGELEFTGENVVVPADGSVALSTLTGYTFPLPNAPETIEFYWDSDNMTTLVELYGRGDYDATGSEFEIPLNEAVPDHAILIELRAESDTRCIVRIGGKSLDVMPGSPITYEADAAVVAEFALDPHVYVRAANNLPGRASVIVYIRTGDGRELKLFSTDQDTLQALGRWTSNMYDRGSFTITNPADVATIAAHLDTLSFVASSDGAVTLGQVIARFDGAGSGDTHHYAVLRRMIGYQAAGGGGLPVVEAYGVASNGYVQVEVRADVSSTHRLVLATDSDYAPLLGTYSGTYNTANGLTVFQAQVAGARRGILTRQPGTITSIDPAYVDYVVHASESGEASTQAVPIHSVRGTDLAAEFVGWGTNFLHIDIPNHAFGVPDGNYEYWGTALKDRNQVIWLKVVEKIFSSEEQRWDAGKDWNARVDASSGDAPTWYQVNSPLTADMFVQRGQATTGTQIYTRVDGVETRMSLADLKAALAALP